MKKKHGYRDFIIYFIVFILSFSMFPSQKAFAEGQMNEITNIDFENGDTWAFTAGSQTTSTVVEEDGNKVLQITGSGSGSRTATKTFENALTNKSIEFNFDWRPMDVSTASCSSDILFSDSSNSPIFRIIKMGGASGEIKYQTGLSGLNMENVETISGISTSQQWLNVNIIFDFETDNVSLVIKDRDNPTNIYTNANISLITADFERNINTITINGNRASGNNLSFTSKLDNIKINTSEETAQVRPRQKVTDITSNYENQISLELGSLKEDIITILPKSLTVSLDNGYTKVLPVSWDCETFNKDIIGDFNFVGNFIINSKSVVINPDNVNANIIISLKDISNVPEIEGYTNAYYTDFGDVLRVVPEFWGFTSNSAITLLDNTDISGNSSPKLKFEVVNQAGARTTTKTLKTPVIGQKILVKADWYPGKVADKGSNPDENSGEFSLIDSNKNKFMGFTNKNKENIFFYCGNTVKIDTEFANHMTWYEIEMIIDNSTSKANVTIKEKDTGTTKSFEVDMEGVAFNSSIGQITLTSVRTAGNNLTWTTYLDNVGLYYTEVEENTLFVIEPKPYHVVYTGDCTSDISSINLPNEVDVLLANSTAKAEISEWVSVGTTWDPNKPGVYTFQGTIKESASIYNKYNKKATQYVYNRLEEPQTLRNMEMLDRGVTAVKADNGVFISWRLLGTEYNTDITFDVYRNNEKINDTPLRITNYLDPAGNPNDKYIIKSTENGTTAESKEVTAIGKDYLSFPLQKPEGGVTGTGEYTYSVNDCSVGDLDGDGEYEIIVKWYPSNAIDSSHTALTGPTLFDAYKLDGTLLWRIDMGLNLTSGAHYNQFLVYDFNSDGKSEFLIKTADATTVYGTTDGIVDKNKIISVIGNPENNGKWIGTDGHVHGGPEYISVFDGATGKVIDTTEYAFALGDVMSWGDDWYNRSDRFLAGVAYLNGKTPSAVYARGYYERTALVAYDLVNGKLVERWTFDSSAPENNGRGSGMGYHSLSVADVDNDGLDEIIYGSVTFDDNGTILYVMDGEMGRIKGSHGDALHVGAFDPDNEGIHIVGVHEDTNVASLEYRNGATGETYMAYYAQKDTGRGVAGNITTNPGFEFWGAAGSSVQTGGGIYNVQGKNIATSNSKLSMNFVMYWDGDLLNELFDNVTISKYNESNNTVSVLKELTGTVSSNGTKATPSLIADIIGDWRDEVVMPNTDSTELRVYTTTIPTQYRLYTLMHDPIYRLSIAWQNVGYNQPAHLGYYLGEDIKIKVLDNQLEAPKITLNYTNIVAAPTASVGSGYYKQDQTVTLNTSTPGATIYYTTDGSLPSKTSNVYKNSITISRSTVLKAIALLDGMDDSNVSIFNYTIDKSYYSEDDDSDSDDNSSNVSPNTTASTTTSQTGVDQKIISQLNTTGNEIKILSETDTIKINGSTLSKLIESDKDLVVTNDIVSVKISSKNLKAIANSSSNNLEITIANFKTKIDTDDSTVLDLLNNTKNISILYDGKDVKNLVDPIVITYSLNGNDISKIQKDKLAGILISEDGKTFSVLGGEFNANNNFEVRTYTIGRIGIMPLDKLTKISLLIGKNSINVNDRVMLTDTAPVIVNDRTMLPLRYVVEAFGAEVKWVGETQKVIVSLNGKDISIAIGEKNANMDVAPYIRDGRTMVSIRYISEQFGANILYDAQTQKIDIYR